MAAKQGPSHFSAIALGCIFVFSLTLGNSEFALFGSGAGDQSSMNQGTTGFAGVLTWHNDNARDGQNLNETLLSPANVTQTKFGKKFSRSVDGNVYAQPLYVPNVTLPGFGALNVIYVATMSDSVYAFDADGLVTSPLWKTTFTNPAKGITTIPTSETGCNNTGKQIGITSTPVIDPTTGTLYVVDGIQTKGADSWQLHALDITTGLDKVTPVTILPSAPGVTFQPKYQGQRGALLLANGNVYVGFGSHCDIEPYRGWLMAYNAATLVQVAQFLVTPKGTEGSLWNGGAGPAADSAGNIYVITANGTFNANTGGQSYSDSFLKLGPTLTVVDWFTPFNQAYLSSHDLDLGSSGVTLLPDQAGAHPHVMISAGKEGRLYVVDRDNLGHFHAGSDSQIVQSIAGFFPNEVMATAAYWNGFVYFATTSDVLKQCSLSNGLVSSTPVHKDTVKVPYTGATPSVSANGTANAIVWLLLNKGAGARLRALDATNVSHKLYDSGTAAGTAGIKFTTPTVANGRVYIGTSDHLVVFGLL